MPGGFTIEQKARVKQKVDTSSRFSSNVLDGVNTTQTIQLGTAIEKISVQSSNDLAGNVSFSIDGKTFFNLTAFVATVPISYSSHNILYIKIDRTSGSGRLTIAAK